MVKSVVTSFLRAEWWALFTALKANFTIPIKIYVFLSIKHSQMSFAISLTCSVDVKVGGFVGNVAHRFDSWALDRDLGGVAQRLVYVHLKWTFGNLLACKQHRHLRKKHNDYPETSAGRRSVSDTCIQKHSTNSYMFTENKMKLTLWGPMTWGM